MLQKQDIFSEILSRNEFFDISNPQDMLAYQSCMEEIAEQQQAQWGIRDSIMNSYDASDPLREQFWQIWTRKEAELTIEVSEALNDKIKRNT